MGSHIKASLGWRVLGALAMSAHMASRRNEGGGGGEEIFLEISLWFRVNNIGVDIYIVGVLAVLHHSIFKCRRAS